MPISDLALMSMITSMTTMTEQGVGESSSEERACLP